ncbi:putative bifunctional diguanylate cyclase/phosphodiesterase [Sulfurimonas marina]|uniref:Bifunctional diguanylate cyclase/phosphodiesterase n=1 Tax=Sulfurimonas marina TaxID=2590551 RepID=A0A7M1AUD9_9BACT|nr:bifunctional diguanylate cyclase/phosphodiesterase [Sulfurimonas marina]QOP41029.1 bifunctional diguanylate cyclase/phosphodiesterase [Sulfurimonas marina]
MKITTLKNAFRVSIFTITVSLFILFYFFSSYIYKNITITEIQKVSESLSKQVFNSMYQVMRKGWSREDLQVFLTETQNSFENSNYSVEIYRGEKVEALFGRIEQGEMNSNVQKVFHTKEKILTTENDATKIVTPIIAKQECMQCHINTQEGDVLGVVSVEYDFSEIIENSKNEHLLFFIFILPLMFIVVYIFSKLFLNKINLSLDAFQKKIHNINSVKDFKNLSIVKDKNTYKEFDQILEGLNTLSKKLKDIAVDKDILEFEVKLLDKMVITSDVIKDWKEYIKDLLHEINIVLPVYCLVTIFKTEEEQYEVEVFWYGKPDKKLMEHLNHIAKEMITEHHHLDHNGSKINHNFSEENLCLTELAIEDIEHEAKSLLLETPKIGGIVGLGIQARLEKDSIHSIVIDSILTTLLNLVGSIKAINKYTEHLEFYATRDPLTGLFSQRVFRDLLEYEVKRAARHKYEFGVLVIDCDNFKPINDTYGHSFGDEFLKAFAELLEESKRDEDILSRYGGDEFTLILPESGAQETFTVANRILENVNKFELIAPDGTPTSMTVSIGIAIFPEHGKQPKELFDVADSMMYKAKYEGKNLVKYPTEIDIEEIAQKAQDQSIVVLDAIKQKKIIPHFQPIMDVKTSKVAINELLMRIEVEDEVISAGRFIETAEALGVVHQMDYMVIEAAFEKIKKLNYQGLLFINLSPKALMIGEFINKIVLLSSKYEIKRENIVFEITERETVKSFSLLEKFVQNLKLEGFSFAIDDFGSGFSSFHYIKRFPIDYIKIDGDFIINIHQDKKDLAFVKSIISLAKELGVKTVAEYVENEEILKFLQEIDVDYGQGFYIGKPSEKLLTT